MWLGQLWAKGPPSEKCAAIGSELQLGHWNSVRDLVVPPDEPLHEPSRETSCAEKG